jgi:hypothetical protein
VEANAIKELFYLCAYVIGGIFLLKIIFAIILVYIVIRRMNHLRNFPNDEQSRITHSITRNK